MGRHEEGIILDLGRSTILTYEWCLGRASNNQAEQHALYLGLDYIISLGIQKVVTLSDSLLVISQAKKRELN